VFNATEPGVEFSGYLSVLGRQEERRKLCSRFALFFFSWPVGPTKFLD
jgi:hypothetical protein